MNEKFGQIALPSCIDQLRVRINRRQHNGACTALSARWWRQARAEKVKLLELLLGKGDDEMMALSASTDIHGIY